MLSEIKVAILDDHQSIIDGLTYRLSLTPRIRIVGTATFGEKLEPMLASSAVDVLLLDISVPNSPDDSNTYPILHTIPRLFKQYPKLSILIISMFMQQSLIDALINMGISGYILKSDQASIEKLDKIVEKIANGGIYFSQEACSYAHNGSNGNEPLLTQRQLQALSLCAAHPDGDSSSLAAEMGITSSTMRNLLSGAYVRLEVRTRAAAIAKAQQMGILPPMPRVKEPAKKKQAEKSTSPKKRPQKQKI